VLDVPAEAGFEVVVAGVVATISLNNPRKLNPQSPHTWHWLALVGADLPETVRVVVVRGQGLAFSAGLDRAMLEPDGGGGIDGVPTLASIARSAWPDADATIEGFQSGFAWLARPDLVSIAVVQGHAIGAGFQLALACDLRIMQEDAQFVMAEPKLGLVPDLGGTKRLVELVGYSRAAEICLSGRTVWAEESIALGLATAVLSKKKIEPYLARLIEQITSLPHAAVSETKALLLAAADHSPEEQRRLEREAQYRRLIAMMNAQ
jgi:enoyl-CoA hydratase/carnithine racemase